MIWTALIVFIVLLLIFDLFVLHKKGEAPSNKRAAVESSFLVGIAMTFSLAVYYIYREGLVANPESLSANEAVLKYITGYLIELSLSVDNLFVIAMIFASFNIPLKYQHRALFWGILGAIVFRGIMIAIGVVLIQQVSWMIYIFGAFLLFTAFRMLRDEDSQQESAFSKQMRRTLNISAKLDEEKFFTRRNGFRQATPLFAALVMIEFTDILFALDSIPAILGVTADPFIVFSSNIFAILGLRSMYFFLANMLEKFKYLKYSVFAILIFVGIKLLVMEFFHFPEWFSLTFIALALLAGVLYSLYKLRKDPQASHIAPADQVHKVSREEPSEEETSAN